MFKLIRMVWKTMVLTFFGGILISWDLPDAARALKMTEDEKLLLDYILIEQNGQLKKVNRNEELSFVRGDILKVSRAYLKNSKEPVGLVEITGFDHSLDVRERVIDTSAALSGNEASTDPKAQVYAVITMSGESLHGVIFLRRLEPVLSYIDVVINGKTRVMREGEALRVKKTDRFKVTNVVTNIADNKNISFSVVPVFGGRKAEEDLQHENYQIILRHKTYVFAKIPLSVESI